VNASAFRRSAKPVKSISTKRRRKIGRQPRRSLRIRAATIADRVEYARLRQALWPDCKGARTALEMRELFSNPRKFGVIVIDCGDGRLGGFVELALRDGVDGAAREITGYLEGWFVEKSLRGQGWGRKLITAAGRWARQRGMVELASDAECWNQAGAAAHQAVGFRESGRVIQFLKRLR
jgi:aminoglycoside 6'-N-acetyltransferase I